MFVNVENTLLQTQNRNRTKIFLDLAGSQLLWNVLAANRETRFLMDSDYLPVLSKQHGP